MSMEQPKIFSSEDQIRLEKERAENQKRFESAADEQNKKRSIGEKLLGKNKTSAIDMAREEALKENRNFNIQKEYDDREAAQRALENSIFSQEMEAAERGEFNLDQSRFKGAHLESVVDGRNSKGAEKAKQLVEINNKVLDNIYEREVVLVRNGEWDPESSALYVSGFSSAEVNELKRQKNLRFKKLEAMHQEQKNIKKENQKLESLKELTESFLTEKSQISSGTWIAETSRIGQISNDATIDSQVSATARQMFNELLSYESKIISDTERLKIDAIYRKEEAQAEKGEWDSEKSYFSTIKNNPRFKKFDSELKKDIDDKFIYLTSVNISGGRAGNNTKGFGDAGNQEKNNLPEERARAILNLNSNVTYEDARNAYRKFMMQNHSDRNPNGVSKEIEDQIRELTQVWPILEKRLKEQKNAKV